MSSQKVCAALISMLCLSFVGVAPAATQDQISEVNQVELAVESRTGAIELGTWPAGIEGYRYTPKTSFDFGKPLNSDGVVPEYVRSSCFRSVESPAGDLDHVQFGGVCTLVVGFTNPTEHTLDRVEVSYVSVPTVRRSVGGISTHTDVGPGEYVEFQIEVSYRNLGGNRDFVTVTGRTNSTDPAERVTFTDTVAYDYWVEATAPSAPTGFGYTFTNNTYTLYWNPPINDGGFPVTGYRVDLLEMGPVPPGLSGPGGKLIAEQIQATKLACNFAGRPELTVCDLPNNQLQQIEGGKNYVFRVRALTDHVISPDVEEWAPKHHSEVFYVANTLGLEPPAKPEPTPLPPQSPDPEPTPPDVLVPVADFQDAPNLISMINSTSYSNGSDAPVLRLYQAYFDRQPDLVGAKYWLGIRRDGHDLLAIAGFMSGGQEFANNYSGVSDQEYLRRVYENMLGRTYDQAGFNYWLDILRGTNDSGLNPNLAKLSRSEVVFYVTGGAEFISNYPYTK
ncbi:MAG: DUF4214 domain-containing protein [Acidimicrobiales bacterium]